MNGNPMQMMGQFQQMMNAMRSGGNPTALIQAFASRNPQAQQLMGILQGKSSDELRQYAENLAATKGVNLNDVANQLGIQLPK